MSNECLILYSINAGLGLVLIWQLISSLKFTIKNTLLFTIGNMVLWLSYYSLTMFNTLCELDVLWSNIFVFIALIAYVYYRPTIIAIIIITLFLWLAISINPLGIILILAIIILELTLFYHYLRPIYWQYWLVICGIILIWLVLPPLPALWVLSIIALIESVIYLYFTNGKVYFRWLFYTPLTVIAVYFNPDMGYFVVPGIILALAYYSMRYLSRLKYIVFISIIAILIQGQFWLQYNSVATSKFQAAQVAIQAQQPLLAQRYYHYVLYNFPENTATYLHLLRLSCYYPQQITPPSIQHEVLPQLANKIIDNNGIHALIELFLLVDDCEFIDADSMQSLVQLLRHKAPTQYQTKLAQMSTSIQALLFAL